MIIGIGHDICAISRIKKMIEKRGDAFVAKHFSPHEQDVFTAVPAIKKASHIAKRWAAKEALAKALGTGIRGDIYLKDIEISNNDLGAPAITLYGGALKQLEKLTPKEYESIIHLSLSDDGDLASAYVIIETRN